MAKNTNASLPQNGFDRHLEDANVLAWSNHVVKVKATFLTIEKVVPGHGKAGV